MKKGFFSGLLVFIILIGIIGGGIYLTMTKVQKTKDSSLVSQLSSLQNKNSNNTSTTNTTPIKSKSEYIATIYVEGQIANETMTYNQKWILSTIKKLKEDSKNVALIMYINSPGGGVYQSDEVYYALLDYKSSGKKVFSYMGALAASGGYYIACPANKIYANRNTLTGSIGVIAGQTFDVTELLKKYGIKTETIHAGKNKNMGNFNEPLTDEQRSILQSLADEAYEQFVDLVAENRKLPIDTVKKLADGRVYTAKQAKANKLIDEICTFETMFNEIKDATLNKPDLQNIEYRYQKDINLYNFLSKAEANNYKNSMAQTLGLPQKVINQMNSDITYPAYIYEF